MPHLGEAAQIRVLGTLPERGDSAALALFTAAVNGSSAPVRLAAIDGMAKFLASATGLFWVGSATRRAAASSGAAAGRGGFVTPDGRPTGRCNPTAPSLR
jgi:hypothetical protein